MPREYEAISLRDLIDETFGPAEFQVDAVLHHSDLKPEVEALMRQAEVRDWADRHEQGSGGRNVTWIPYADEYPNDDEPDEAW
jgi:hypothetical protein